jgi:hypothetical protein
MDGFDNAVIGAPVLTKAMEKIISISKSRNLET